MTGGFEADTHSLAVPLIDATTTCIGAVAVAAPTTRMTHDLRSRIIAELFDSAHHRVALWGESLPDALKKVRADAV